MALSEIEELKADLMACDHLIASFGMLLFGLFHEKDGYERALRLLEKMQIQQLTGLTAIISDTEKSQAVGRRVERRMSVTFDAIRKQLEAAHAKDQH